MTSLSISSWLWVNRMQTVCTIPYSVQRWAHAQDAVDPRQLYKHELLHIQRTDERRASSGEDYTNKRGGIEHQRNCMWWQDREPKIVVSNRERREGEAKRGIVHCGPSRVACVYVDTVQPIPGAQNPAARPSHRADPTSACACRVSRERRHPRAPAATDQISTKRE